MKLSVIVITLNEEKNIEECLKSVQWVDEIIVVDSNSTDKTVELAKKFTQNIFQLNESYGIKKNFGIEKAKSEWILWLDADERITDELRIEIQQTITQNKFDAYFINRKSFFINKFIKHCGWYPDYSLRLFEKTCGLKFSESLVHESIESNIPAGKLQNEILHYTDLDFEHYLNKLNHYTTQSAEELKNKNQKATFIDILFRPAFTFLKMYFFKLGILDGYTGLTLCILSSLHVMTKYSKLYFIK